MGRDLGALTDKLKGCFLGGEINETTNNDSISVLSPSSLIKWKEHALAMIDAHGDAFDTEVYNHI